jgi:ribokinase
MDIRMVIPDLPHWTQAVQADSCELMPGGKGLNQAIAASKLGAEVAMISSVGDDAFGKQLLSKLQDDKISTEHVRIAHGTSAITNVFVNYQAEASFIGWKNERQLQLTPTDIDQAAPIISAAQAMLITLEVPLDAVDRAVSIVLNPAPPPDARERVSHVLLQSIDAVIPNTWEAERLLAQSGDVSGEPVTPRTLATRLGHIMGPDGVACVTTASSGCVVFANSRVREYAGYPANPVDTTGGSDAFCAAYALAIVNGKPVDQAIEEANAAGSIAVGRPGGAPSMPTATQLQNFLRARGRGNTSTG